MDFSVFSKMLSQFGFFPRMYTLSECRKSAGEPIPVEKQFERLLRWYVNSGIPVAVNVGTEDSNEVGHSLLCIGYGRKDEDFQKRLNAYLQEYARGTLHPECRNERFDEVLADSVRFVGRRESDGDVSTCLLVDAADLPRDYVVMDDGQLPYALTPYQQLSSFSDMRCQIYVVPLHRGMALDALDARVAFLSVLGTESLGLLRHCEDLVEGAPIVSSMYLTSARSYKRSRVHDLREKGGPAAIFSTFYELLPMPHFIWVMELYHAQDYLDPESEKMAFAEIVLDASSGGDTSPVDRVVLLRYPQIVYYQYPDSASNAKAQFIQIGNSKELRSIKPFCSNLKSVAKPK